MLFFGLNKSQSISLFKNLVQTRSPRQATENKELLKSLVVIFIKLRFSLLKRPVGIPNEA